MVDGTAAKEKPKEPQWAGATRGPEEATEETGNTKTVPGMKGKVPDAVLRVIS